MVGVLSMLLDADAEGNLNPYAEWNQAATMFTNGKSWEYLEWQVSSAQQTPHTKQDEAKNVVGSGNVDSAVTVPLNMWACPHISEPVFLSIEWAS